MSQARHAKRDREKARMERAAEKRARRIERNDARQDSSPAEQVSSSDQDALLAELAALHQRFQDGAMTFEAFEEARDEVVEKLANV